MPSTVFAPALVYDEDGHTLLLLLWKEEWCPINRHRLDWRGEIITNEQGRTYRGVRVGPGTP
jgi:hypothetical protein